MPLFNFGNSFGTNPYGLATSGLQSRFNSFLEKYPNYMVYARADRRFPCALCLNNDQDPQPLVTCPFCFGLGYKLTLEKHQTRFYRQAMPDATPASPMGYLAKFPATVFTQQNNFPQKRDLYFEVEWTTPIDLVPAGGQIASLINAFSIQENFAERESSVTFIACGCSPFDFDRAVLENYLLGHPL